MNYNAAAEAPAYDEEELPCVPSMDMLQDYYNTGHRYADKQADEDDDDDNTPSWD